MAKKTESNKKTSAKEIGDAVKTVIDRGLEASQKGLSSAGKAISSFGDKSVQEIKRVRLKAKQDKAYTRFGKVVYEKLTKEKSVSFEDEDVAKVVESLDKIAKDMKALGRKTPSRKNSTAKNTSAKKSVSAEKTSGAKKTGSAKKATTARKSASAKQATGAKKASASKKSAAKKTTSAKKTTKA